MPHLTDEQILAVFNLKHLPEVSSVSISQNSKFVDISIHGKVDADVNPIMEAINSVIPGVKFGADEPYAKNDRLYKSVLMQTFEFRDYPTLDITIFAKKKIELPA